MDIARPDVRVRQLIMELRVATNKLRQAQSGQDVDFMDSECASAGCQSPQLLGWILFECTHHPFSPSQVRRAVVLEGEIILKVTTMTGQDTGRILPPTANRLAPLRPTLPNLPESRNATGPSGTETAGTDGLNLPPFSAVSPGSFCCFYLLWLLLPPCGDSRAVTAWTESSLSAEHTIKTIWLHQQEYEKKRPLFS